MTNLQKFGAMFDIMAIVTTTVLITLYFVESSYVDNVVFFGVPIWLTQLTLMVARYIEKRKHCE